MPITVSVLRRFVPLKHARYDVSEFIERSCSVVTTINETYLSTSKLTFLGEVRELTTRLASSTRFWRTSHQGDSGAKKRSGRMIIGQTHLHPKLAERARHEKYWNFETHWIAKGILYAHSVFISTTPRRTPAAIICPIDFGASASSLKI
jgi:hypothetical protein